MTNQLGQPPSTSPVLAISGNMSATNADGSMKLLPTPGGTGKEGDDQFAEFASHMALVHNIIIRGWNSIYLQAPKIKSADVPDFLHYCDAYHAFVLGHHDSEEAVLFPKIEETTGLKGVMDDDVAEHAAFHGGLDATKEYIDKCLASPSEYRGADFVKILDSYGEAFYNHLAHEPLKLLSLNQYDFPMREIGDATTQHALARYSTTDVLPILWYNLDTKFEGGKWASFPPLPTPIKWSLVNEKGRLRSNWWRFSSCSANLVERDELLALRKDY